MQNKNIEYIYSPAIQAGLATGRYVQVYRKNGFLLDTVRDTATGHFVGKAIGAVVNNSPVSPIVVPAKLVLDGINIVQTHIGFQQTYKKLDVIQAGLQSLQTSVGVLQATTAVISVGVATGVALSAVNLYQTLKLRKAVERLEVKVENGFLNLEQALKDQGVEIKQLILAVAQDVKFEQHRLILVRAYGLFTQALHRFQMALKLQDINRRNAEIDAARGMLFNALADYTNPQLLEETCAAGQLRRLECAWAIDQTIITTYQVQNEFIAVSDRLSHLQNKIRQDTVSIINACKSENELDFLFPEIVRIHDHDLAVLNSWQNHVDWVKSLPPEDAKLLLSSDFSSSEFTANPDTNPTTTALAVPQEQLVYENLKQKSHPLSLELQLKFMVIPQLRLEYESYISQQAAIAGYKALIPSNLQQASDLAVANLYWYFKVRDGSKDQPESTV